MLWLLLYDHWKEIGLRFSQIRAYASAVQITEQQQ